jgi:hypothetical protein
MNETLTLHLREQQISIGWLLTCSLSLLLIAIASARQVKLIPLVFLGFYRVQKEDSFNHDSERMSLATFRLLTLNFIIGAALALLLVIDLNAADFKTWLIVFLIPMALLLYWKAGQGLIFAMIGKHPIIRHLKYHLRFAICAGGFFFLTVAIIITLNKSLMEMMFSVLLVGFFIMFLNRILKGIITSMLMGIRWYYILLYFCAVEVLPLIAIFVFFGNKLSSFVK